MLQGYIVLYIIDDEKKRGGTIVCRLLFSFCQGVGYDFSNCMGNRILWGKNCVSCRLGLLRGGVLE